MYDCSTEFNAFYRNDVVLPETVKNELREKRKLNVKRLKEGLSEYNEEKKKDYKVAEDRIQGSMAMHTIVQNDKNDYDIDVGIVFESDNLHEIGPLSTRNIVANALERKTKQFAEPPEVKTSCVRLKYASTGYHVDFAIFKRYKKNPDNNEYTYEHAGSQWSERDLKGIEEWFSNEIKEKGTDLRKIVRLSKMFCKSRETWKNMPSGLIQTVLCVEEFESDYTRIDELFYYTMEAILKRITEDIEVIAPVDNGRALITRESDRQKMNNFKNRLESKLSKLDVLFDKDCTHNIAINAWKLFFNHDYWANLENKSLLKCSSESKSIDYMDTEQFIEDLYPVYEQFDVTIDCKVEGNGFSLKPLSIYLEKYAPKLKRVIPHKFSVKCSIGYTNCISYDKILWKVLNVGYEAKKRNDIRGQILDRGSKITENTKFAGPHYIECYLISKGVCVAIGHIDVPIGKE